VNWISIVGYGIFFLPAVLLPWGWLRCLRKDLWPRSWREYSVAAGLGCASISSVCLFGVVLYLRMVHIGYWNEYLLAAAWGVFNWPLSISAVILAVIGKGVSRTLLMLTACGLVAVWTVAFIH